MLRRPWQIWSAYLICLAVVVAALGALTRMALKLDASEAEARRQAKQEQTISVALWRMDTELTRLLATEAGRPVTAFQPFLSMGGKGAPPVPSPLLVQPSELVLLNFEAGADGQWRSPQAPAPEWRELACQNGTTAGNLDVSCSRLDELQKAVPVPPLLASLPDVISEPWPVNSLAINNGFANNVDAPNFYNYNDVNAPQQQWGPGQSELPPNASPLSGEQAALQSDGQRQFGRGFDPAPQAARSSYRGGQSRSQAPQPPSQMLQQAAPAQEYQNRLNTAQLAARQELENQRRAFMLGAPEWSDSVRNGPSVPVWQDQRLLLVRRAKTAGDREVLQGCWLDWPRIKKLLQSRIADLLPNSELVPVRDEAAPLGRMLATLPVQLLLPAPAAAPLSLGPLPLTLLIAWLCMAAAAVAVAILLHGVLQLSERRATFVSAVTHELRTPLTTFRMYAEMLSGGMVPREEQRQEYLQTLRVEADRLCHLVENVLRYARLERKHVESHKVSLPAGQLVEQCRQRLEERVHQSDMRLAVEIQTEAGQRELTTDVGVVEQILFNLIDNACKYAGAAEQREILLTLHTAAKDSQLVFSVRDFGAGIPADIRKRLFQPFSKSAEQAANSAPGVGLGLALCRRLARQLGGRLQCAPVARGAQFDLTLPG